MLDILMPVVLTLSFAAPLITALYLKSMKKLRPEQLCTLLIVSGIVLRLAYVYYTDDYQRQHDVGFFDEGNNYHAGYIMYLVKNHHLLPTDPRDRWQFYHPPLHHIISAVILSVVDIFVDDYRPYAPDVLQLVAAVYSSLFCVVAYKLMKLIGIKDRALVLSTAVVVFHPTLIILSASCNNDMLSALFAISAVYFTARWAKDTKMRDIIAAAFCMGLGMITKLTVGLLAPAMAAVFLTVLIKKRAEWKKLIPQFIVFGVICVPIGLSWTIRNAVKFGMSPGYVPELGTESGQYIDVPVLKRLFDFSVYQLASPFTQWEWNGAPYNEFNPVIALLKNAMFDEETFFTRSITLQSFCTLLFFAGAVTAVISVFAFFMMWRRKNDISTEVKLLLTITFAVIFANYIIFCINYPQVCTENMRYCVPLIFSGAGALGVFLGEEENGALRYVQKTAAVSMTSMCCLSAFVYMAMLFYCIA